MLAIIIIILLCLLSDQWGWFLLPWSWSYNVSWNNGSTDTPCTGEYASGECDTIDCVAVCGECDN